MMVHDIRLAAAQTELRHVLAAAERALLSACAADVSSESPKPDQLVFLRFWVRRESLVKLGALTLDTLSAIDLSGLPLSESALRRWCRLARSGKWTFLDWNHPVLRISGCAVRGGPVKLMEIAV